MSPAWISLVPRPTGVSVARRFARSKVTGYEDEEFRSDVELVVSELVTNAYEALMRAAAPNEPEQRETIRLGVQCAPRWVHLRVADPIPQPPKRRTASEADEDGRGLSIVNELAFWWVHERLTDKTIHAVMTVPDTFLTQYDLDQLVSGL